MAANDGTVYTNFSNIEVGGPNSGGSIKVGLPVTVTDAATYTVLASNAGKLHMIPDLTASCTLTLPTAAKGLSYEFMYIGAAADAQNWVIQAAATTALAKGGVVHLDADAGSAGDEVVPVYANGSSNYILTVTTPEVGTSIKVISDGTYWYVNGTVVSATAPAFSG